MKLRIISDGTPPGTKVFMVDEAGIETPVPGVMEVTWKCEVGHTAAAQIVVNAFALDVEARQAQFTIWHPPHQEPEVAA